MFQLFNVAITISGPLKEVLLIEKWFDQCLQ